MVVKKVDNTKLSELYNSGLSLEEIARSLGVCKTSVFVNLRKIGAPLRKVYQYKLDVEDIRNQYIAGYSYADIAKKLNVSVSVIAKRLKEINCPVRSPSERAKLAAKKAQRQPRACHPIQNSAGYLLVYSPNHPRAQKIGYVMEHILVWEKTHNRPLPKGWVIHHLNGIKSDNRPQNLLALPGKKHKELLKHFTQRIRELEAENKLLQRALDQSQMIFYINEN